MEKTTILLADDHTLIRELWSLILNSDPRFKVVAETDSGEQAVELARQLRPQIVLMDINLAGMDGIEATKQIRKFSPGSKILAISQHTQPVYAREIMRKGAMGYVTKNSTRAEMFKAIIEIQNGRKYICDQIKNNLSVAMIDRDAGADKINMLTRREIEIISHIKKGDSSRQIALNLHITLKTVEVHRYNILRKLDLKNSLSLVNFINHSQLVLETDLHSHSLPGRRWLFTFDQ